MTFAWPSGIMFPSVWIHSHLPSPTRRPIQIPRKSIVGRLSVSVDTSAVSYRPFTSRSQCRTRSRSLWRQYYGPFTPSVSVNTATILQMMLAILFSLKTMESLEKWVTTPFWGYSIVFNENRMASVIAKIVGVDADDWYKRAIIVNI